LIKEGILIGKAEGIAIGEQKGIAIGEQKGIAIGEQKGIAIGKAEGKAVSLLTIIQLKFGPLSDEIKERIEAAPEADLDTWLQRVLFVGTLDELFLDKRRFS